MGLLPLPPGLLAVTGDEGTGKTRLLRHLAGDLPAPPGSAPRADALWLDLSLPAQDQQTPHQAWDALRQRCRGWNASLQQDLADALGLDPHLDKRLFMLSTGSRRKVALVGLLASGATVTCLDHPFAALDGPSARVVREFLADMADHPSRTWVVADYVADPRLPWRRVLSLDRHGSEVLCSNPSPDEGE
ncbi:ABC transporter ATP-binding protein [Ramlibacter sp.]|uniref:ABC transporter ATP-binding protein n=1 Tax=Ramlibacter sp. TaxID=1917967 RepID=UPI002D78F4AB|nr:ATP-binding cassette domain-containing protein [Ramlibacter sp.]